MIRLLKISALLIAIVVPSSASGAAGTFADTEPMEIQKAGDAGSPIGNLPGESNLFGIHHQTATVIHTLQRLSLSTSIYESQDHVCGGNYDEQSVRRDVAIYLRFSKRIDCSFTNKKILFPFHSFL